MKRLLVVFVTMAFVAGCGARVEVAKDKIKEKIDSMLGSMDVKRKEIEIGVKGLKEGIAGIAKDKIRVQVKSDQIQRQIEPLEKKVTSIDESLKTLRDHLKGGKSAEIAGKTYSPQELKELADRVIQARVECTTQLGPWKDTQARMQKVVTTLEGKQQDLERRLHDLERQLAVIDTNRIALKSMQDAAVAMGGNDESLTKSMDQLQDKVTNLYADVEAELRTEGTKWDDAATTKEVDNIDSVIAKLQKPSDAVSEIDKILGKSK